MCRYLPVFCSYLGKDGIWPKTSALLRCYVARKCQDKNTTSKYAPLNTHLFRAEIAKFEKGQLFTTWYYKVVTTISTNEELSAMVMAKFCAKVGCNFVWEDVLPTSRLADLQYIRVSVKAAYNTFFKDEVVISLSDKIDGCHAKEAVRAAPKLATKIILGPAFIDKESDRNETKSSQIKSRSGVRSLYLQALNMRMIQSLPSVPRQDPLSQRSGIRQCGGWQKQGRSHQLERRRF